MNSLDPSLAKYLSSSKQEIYNAYHGTGTSTLSSDYAQDEPARKMKKKKKRKLAPDAESSAGIGPGTGTGMIIEDEDGGYNPWTAVNRRAGGDDEDDDESGFAPVVQHRASAAFKPVSQPAAPPQQAQEEEAIPADEAPLVIGGVVDEAPTASSSTGSSAFAPKRLQGGLQTAAQLREESQRRRAAMEAEKEATRAKAAAARQAQGSDGDGNGNGAEETVYRDKSGRRIDAKAEKAEQKRRKRQELEKEIAKMEWGKGLVQREEKERRQRELEEMAAKPMARYADDADMNDEMKDVQRWNDPAARFLTETSKDKNKGKSRAPARPRYMGPAPPPNRFGILPGYRWDGVDRSNGFEKEYFQAGNKRKVQEAASRVYSTEDM